MLTLYLLALAAEVSVPDVPEPVADGLWNMLQEAATLVLALLSIAALVRVTPWFKRWQTKREAQRLAERQRRNAEIKEIVHQEMAQVQGQVEDIHHTTHVNGNSADPKTLRDNVENMRQQFQALNSTVAAIAVNQANHTADPNAHRQSDA